MASKYFHLQFNREKTGEAEFEEKLRKMAKENNLTISETVIALVMAVDNFKVSYNVNLELSDNSESYKPALELVSTSEQTQNERMPVMDEKKSPLDAILNK